MKRPFFAVLALVCIVVVIVFTIATSFAPDMAHKTIGFANAIIWALIGNVLANLAK